MSKELKIGFLQQHNTADVKDNIERLADGIADLARRGAQLIVLQELHNSLYFCQVEDVNNFDLAEPVPGPSTEIYGELAKRYQVVIVTSLFERRAAGLYHTLPLLLNAMALLRAVIVRCIFLMTPAIMRSSISRRAILASTPYKRVWDD